ncbi:hypothetical protein E4N62_40495 [Streptomyces sp. MNU76]|uniref:hypothetical protein n=1 Tax=Streptomyces sp. MNU76 TaxID=2560026 RepID=UPI001E532F50|nr:hypothetical protein [Streptomyces sp. MNU76]MCC9710966.1 hypothetical protein [Streptomyces sp. MNU76]
MKTSGYVKRIGLVVGICATALVSAPAQAAHAAESCGYTTSSVDPTVTHKGAGTPAYNNGLTSFRGRVFQLRTEPIFDYSQGNIASGYKSGDKVWVDISVDQGKSWTQCGPYYRDRTYFAYHKGKWMRVCVNVDGITQCATNGNKTGPGGSKWWDD